MRRAGVLALSLVPIALGGCEALIGSETFLLASAGDSGIDVMNDAPAADGDALVDRDEDQATDAPTDALADASLDAPPSPGAIVTGLPNPTSLVVIAGTSYWTQAGDGTLVSCSATSCGTPSVLVSGQASPQSLTTDGTQLYWVNRGTLGLSYTDGSVMTCAIATCSQATAAVLAANQKYPATTLYDPTSLFLHWTSENTVPNAGAILKCSTGACVPAAVGGGVKDRPIGIGFDAAGTRYWANMGSGASNGSIVSCPTQGCAAYTVLAANEATPYALVVSGSRVYWTDFNAAGAVRSVATLGGPATTIAQSQANPAALAVDALHVFWVNRGTGDAAGQVERCSLTAGCGGSPTTLAATQRQPVALYVDTVGNVVYWANFGTPGTRDGEIGAIGNP